jgi:sterol desaturase/sphingolipid hydroxylase (fatty acid hydroxylase superfamily)
MPNLIALAIPAFIVLMAIEAIADALMRRDLYEIKDSAASITMGLGNVAVNLVAKTMQLAIFGVLYRFRIFHLGYQWWVWGLLFFADEFSYYWFHRASHECRLFWASHVVHHSSQRYNLSTALRQSWTGTFMGWIFWMWLPLVGFHPVMVLTMQAVSLLYQFWIHNRTGAFSRAIGNGPEQTFSSPRTPWFELALHRPQPWRHADRVGSMVRNICARRPGGPAALRADEEHPHLQSGAHCVSRMG